MEKLLTFDFFRKELMFYLSPSDFSQLIQTSKSINKSLSSDHSLIIKSKYLKLAINKERVELVRFMIPIIEKKHIQDVMDLFAKYGEFEVFKTLFLKLYESKQISNDQFSTFFSTACCYSRMELFEFLEFSLSVFVDDWGHDSLLCRVIKSSKMWSSHNEIIHIDGMKRMEMLKRVFEMGDKHPEILDSLYEALRIANRFGRFEEFKYLITHEKNKTHFPKYCENAFEYLTQALEGGFGSLCDFHKQNLKDSSSLLNLKPIQLSKGFERCCEDGRLEGVKYFIENYPSFDPTSIDNWGFRLACSNGHLDIAKYLYSLKQKYPATTPTSLNNYALGKAASKGHLEVVKWLISLRSEHPETDLAANNNFAFHEACTHYQLKTVEFILDKVDEFPGIKIRGSTISQIVQFTKYTRMLRLVLERKEKIIDRRTFTQNVNDAIYTACELGKRFHLDLLLEQRDENLFPEIGPFDKENLFLAIAVQQNQFEMVRYLLERFPDLSPFQNGDHPLIAAASMDRLEILQYFFTLTKQENTDFPDLFTLREIAQKHGALAVYRWIKFAFPEHFA